MGLLVALLLEYCKYLPELRNLLADQKIERAGILLTVKGLLATSKKPLLV